MQERLSAAVVTQLLRLQRVWQFLFRGADVGRLVGARADEVERRRLRVRRAIDDPAGNREGDYSTGTAGTLD